MLKPDFLFKQKVTIERWKERGISADVYEAPVTVKCCIHLNRVGSFGGSTPKDSVSGQGTLYLTAGTRISPKDKITMNGYSYQAISCLPVIGLDGVESHVEVGIR